MNSTALSAHDVSFAYPGAERDTLTGASVAFGVGERTVLLGGNGSGKSTLLQCCSGALRPRSGTVFRDGEPLAYTRGALHAHRSAVQLVLQNPDDQLFSASVEQDVSYGPINQGLSDRDVRARVADALEVLGIGDLASRPVHHLSYGQRKRVAIAGALAMRPRVLLLDEPTAGLDPAAVDEMICALERLEDDGTTVVMATHDVDLALRWARRAAVVAGGSVTSGPVAEILSDADLLVRCRLRPPAILRLLPTLIDSGLLPEAARNDPPRDPEHLAAALGAQRLTDHLIPTPTATKE